MATGHSSTLSKGLRLLQVLLADGGRSTLSTVSERAGMPLPTAHRLALTLEADGYLVRHDKGSFLPGPQLQRLGAVRQGTADAHATRIRRRLAQFARRHRVLVHFGVLEDGMVTYLVKENGGTEGLFTAEQMQLEAYCSAVGKVLLAALPDDQCEAYLANGPFVALTRHTLTDPDDIRRELAEVRETGAAFDRFEIREDLFCVAVPVKEATGNTLGGLSCSFLNYTPDFRQLARLRRALRRLALQVAQAGTPPRDPMDS
ncbi:IclR family transcriptional regulator [Sphingobium baderi]|uniref:IclR family transcriptional regulator n=1 Tax=Sphingobium baderi TaxID=1332080 RepID=UPI002B407113|nr:IclR family transcriptional regulator [Sphingobium baderi]WRD75878.1 IclR family transcriptional regulator [Sphingobium baderi]